MPVVIEPGDRLYVGHRKRLSHAYVTTESGVTELCIYYGTKEVSFDEPRLFPFGHELLSRPAFVAETATSWGPGYAWDEVREMLEVLVAEGVIKRGEAVDDPRGTGLVPSRLEPSLCPVPRWWSAEDCEAITRELGGRAVELGHLEIAVPTYRVAHAALDSDGRQVGEANVFPAGLRLDRETEWRVCQYSGSRYRDEAPMNVTALKAMIKYWKPMMAAALEIRAAILGRLPRSQAGWTTGDIHTFARVVLALPAFPLMLRGGTVPQPPIHPILSSLFRVTDGIQITTHAMLFLSAERSRRPEEPLTADELYSFAERNGLFLDEFGVCAGPKAMMDELFAVVFDGTPVRGTEGLVQPPEVRALLDQLPDAIDYGMLGLQIWAVSRSIWMAMRDVYVILLGIFGAAQGATGERLLAQLRDGWREMEKERIADDHELAVHRVAYADAYDQPWQATRRPVGPATLAACIAPCPETALHVAVAGRLSALLTASLADTELGGAPVIARIVETLVHYLRAEQTTLASLTRLQAAVNALLEREPPSRPLSVRDIRVTFVMQSGTETVFPYLFDVLEETLGFRIDCTADSIEVQDRRAG